MERGLRPKKAKSNLPYLVILESGTSWHQLAKQLQIGSRRDLNRKYVNFGFILRVKSEKNAVRLRGGMIMISRRSCYLVLFGVK